MRILVFHGTKDAIFYHRAEMPYGQLNAHGHEVHFIQDPKLAASMITQVDLAVFSVCIEPNGAALMVLCAQHDVPTILDLDDNLFSVPPTNPLYVVWGDDPLLIQRHHEVLREFPHMTPALKPLAEADTATVIHSALARRKLLEGMLQMAKAVTVTVPELQKVYGEFNKNVAILPNCIDGPTWGAISQRKTKRLTLLWAGGNTHYDALSFIAPVVQKFLHKYDAEMITIGVPELQHSTFKDFPQGKLTSLGWQSFERYQRALATADIILAPDAAVSFDKGKSPLRAMHANAVGVPVIGSPTIYGAYLRASGGGLIARTQTEWFRALSQLRDEGRRKSLAGQGKKYIYENCTYQDNYHLWTSLCASLIVRRPHARGLQRPN